MIQEKRDVLKEILLELNQKTQNLKLENEIEKKIAAHSSLNLEDIDIWLGCMDWSQKKLGVSEYDQVKNAVKSLY